MLQSQNSYNSGLWTSYKTTTVEDQQKFAVPLNPITETLFYNHRMIIDSNLYNADSEPRAWLISKVNRISPNGIARITLAQDVFDQHNDYIEKDESGMIIGKWANYYDSNIAPTPIVPDENVPTGITSKITCSGKPQFKIGGSAKTFTVTFYDNESQEMTDIVVGSWALLIGDERVPDSLLDISEVDGNPNKIRVKFLGNDSYIGKIITIKTELDDITSSLDVEVIPL